MLTHDTAGLAKLARDLDQQGILRITLACMSGTSDWLRETADIMDNGHLRLMSGVCRAFA